MEFIWDERSITLNEKVLNSYDRFVLDFIKLLNKAKINYVLLSGYVAILFGRSRQTEDIDIVIETIDKKKFVQLWNLLSKEFECLNTDDHEEAFDEYLNKKTALRFSRPKTYIPNMEIKFVHQLLEREALEKSIAVKLEKKELRISPLELQIAFKLFLGSNKDIEDARHLHLLFREYLNPVTFHHYLHELHQKKNAKRYGFA